MNQNVTNRPKIDEVDQDSEKFILNFICHNTKKLIFLSHNLKFFSHTKLNTSHAQLKIFLSLSLMHVHTHTHTHTHRQTQTHTTYG